MSPLAWMPKKLKGFLPIEGLLAYRHMGASCIYSICLNNLRGSFTIYLFLCPQPSAVSDGTINVCLQGAATMFVNKSHTRGTSNGPPATTRMIRISVKSNSAGFAASPLFRSVHLCFFLLLQCSSEASSFLFCRIEEKIGEYKLGCWLMSLNLHAVDKLATSVCIYTAVYFLVKQCRLSWFECLGLVTRASRFGPRSSCVPL